MPRIVGQLGGITLYSWVFSIYLLTSTTSVPLYGKLADLYGRKPVLLAGMIIFLLGSLACALARSMVQLILFRALQGLGAGALFPLVLTIFADLSHSPDERNRLQGLFGAVWGVSSVAGPALGGLIVDHLTWPWVFYLNLPFGLLSMTIFVLFFREQVMRRSHRLDYAGAVLLTAAVATLLLALLQGGAVWPWNSPQELALIGGSLLLAVLFVLVERRAAEPIIPLSLFANRTIAVSSLGGLLLGGLMFGITSYIPLFVQGVRGSSATEAGFVLIPESLSWSLISILIALILRAFGYRRTVLLGAFIAAIGFGLILLFPTQSALPFLLFTMLLVGCGLGLSSNVYTLSVQATAPRGLIGVASASTQFVRTIGGTIGVAVMGAILNAQLSARFAALETRLSASGTHLPSSTSLANLLLSPQLRATLPANLLAQLQRALADSLFWVYALFFALALLALLNILWFPRETRRPDAPESEEDPALQEVGRSG